MLITGFVLQVQAQTSQEAQKRAQQEKEMQVREMEMQLKKQQLEQEQKLVEVERAYAEQARSSGRARESAVIYTRPGGSDEGPYFIPFSQENQSQLTLRNSFNGTSDASIGEFDVDKSTSYIRCTINGKVRSGIITIEVLYPGGKVFKKLSITSSAEISFSQSLTIKEEDQNKYVGKWKYEVTADKAEGNYILSIMTH